jgi:hypothetical protein
MHELLREFSCLIELVQLCIDSSGAGQRNTNSAAVATKNDSTAFPA